MVFLNVVFIVFIGVGMLLQHFCRTQKRRNLLLIVLSLLFYLACGTKSLVCMLACFVVAFFSGAWMRIIPRRRKVAAVIGVLAEVVLLVVFRQYGMLTELKGITAGNLSAAEFSGIVCAVWCVLRGVDYILTVYRSPKCYEPDMKNILLYISLFPVACIGPVTDYAVTGDVVRRRKLKRGDTSEGISRFSRGFVKTTVLGASMLALSESMLPADLTVASGVPVLSVWIGLMLYGIAICVMLIGLSDIAVGSGLLFGFNLPEQFRFPLCADSVCDFWKRTFISVGDFFERHFTGLVPENGSSAKGILKLTAVWLVFGILLGEHITMLVFAVYFLLLIILERYALKSAVAQLPVWLRRVFVLLLILVSLIFVRCNDLPQVLELLKRLVGIGSNAFISKVTLIQLLSNLPLILFSVLTCTPAWGVLREKVAQAGAEDGTGATVAAVWDAVSPALFLILSLIALTGATSNPFMFIQF